MTIQPLPCGCTVTVADERNPDFGTIQNPLTVRQCPTHAASQVLNVMSIARKILNKYGNNFDESDETALTEALKLISD